MKGLMLSGVLVAMFTAALVICLYNVIESPAATSQPIRLELLSQDVTPSTSAQVYPPRVIISSVQVDPFQVDDVRATGAEIWRADDGRQLITIDLVLRAPFPQNSGNKPSRPITVERNPLEVVNRIGNQPSERTRLMVKERN